MITCSSVDDVLSEFTRVFADLSECLGRNSFQGCFGFLDAQDEEGNCSDIDNGLSQFSGVLSDLVEGPGGGFFDGGVEFFEADN